MTGLTIQGGMEAAGGRKKETKIELVVFISSYSLTEYTGQRHRDFTKIKISGGLL